MGRKVLLADDSITIQKVVAIIFSNEDYALTVVDNGDAALQKAREIVPDIMLVDALMPGKNGYEVCQEVRRDPALKNVPLLLMTGAFEPFDEDKARQCGADDFISKPFESQNLIDVTSKLLRLGEERLQNAGAEAPPVAVPVEPELAAWAEPSGVGFAEETEFAEPPSLGESVPAATAEAVTSPAVAPQPLEVSTDDDLWGVFDLEEAAGAEAAAVESPGAVVSEQFDVATPDEAFAFDEEEPSPAVPVAKGAAHGAGFEPFGEQEFSFDETPIDTAAAFASADAFALEPGAAAADAFGEIAPPVEEPATFVEPDELAFAPESFDEAAAFAAESAEEPAPFVAETFAEPAPFVPHVESAPFVEPVAASEPVAPAVTTAIPAAVTFDEEQLKAMLSKISREVIEKIVWEVVPDLAEILIKEEIKKLKAGLSE